MLTLEQKALIRTLRGRGYTYAEICDDLGVIIPKGSLSYICKNVILPDGYTEKLHIKNSEHMARIQQLARIKNREILESRIRAIESRAEKIVQKKLTDDAQKICLAILYAGEGSKHGSYRGLSLGSSDATILKLYMGLLEAVYGKTRDGFRARVQYRADQDLASLQEYWSRELSIPMENFYKSSPDKRTIGRQTKKDSYKGVCVVSCKGADIQLELASIARRYSQEIWGVSSFG